MAIVLKAIEGGCANIPLFFFSQADTSLDSKIAVPTRYDTCLRVAARCAMIKRLRLNYPLPPLCRVLNVSVSGYYAWSTRKPSKRAQEDARLEIEIQAAHKRTRGTCGPERLKEDMQEH